jgi:hypothetical protein
MPGSHKGRALVTTKSMRQFSLDCLRWAEQTPNPSDRQMIVSVARTWLQTAAAIDRSVAAGHGEALPDLKRKLN